jgi:hypothetical protein
MRTRGARGAQPHFMIAFTWVHFSIEVTSYPDGFTLGAPLNEAPDEDTRERHDERDRPGQVVSPPC